jgi:hypothetical protein
MGNLAFFLVVGFLVAAIVASIRRSRALRRSPYPLNVRDEGGWAVVEVEVAPLPGRVAFNAVAAGFVASWPVTLAGFGGFEHGGGILLVWLGIGIGLGVPFLFLSSWRYNRRRMVQKQPFAVRTGEIRLPNGQVISANRFYSIRQRNTQDGRMVTVNGPNAVGHASAQWAAVTARRLVDVSYLVELEHDGVATPLAGGLTASLAQAVCSEVAERTGGFRTG